MGTEVQTIFRVYFGLFDGLWRGVAQQTIGQQFQKLSVISVASVREISHLRGPKRPEEEWLARRSRWARRFRGFLKFIWVERLNDHGEAWPRTTDQQFSKILRDLRGLLARISYLPFLPFGQRQGRDASLTNPTRSLPSDPKK